MPQPTILRVARRDNRWHYILIPPGDLMLRHAAHPAVETEIETDLLQLLCGQMADAVHSANASAAQDGGQSRKLLQIGRALFATLFPADAALVRSHLANLTTPLLVLSDEREIPWETLFVANSEDPAGFLGLRAEVGRSLVSVHVPQIPVVRPHKRWRCLLIANPTGDLDANGEEVCQLERWFAERGFVCRMLSGEQATMEEVVSQLLEEWDIIHYSGHVDSDAGSLVLHDGMLTPRAIQPLLRGSPVVFTNGCESASAEMLTEALIGGGAQAVIGSLYQLPPQGAAKFSKKFYECLLTGESLGTAVRVARQYVFERPDCAAVWASFVLFGDPSLKVQVERDPLEDALKRIGLGPESFDAEAAAVIREAYRCGYHSGSITSACILAGFLAVSDPVLLDRLRYFRIRPDALDRVFRSVFEKGHEKRKQSRRGDQPLEFSSNAEKWLKAAWGSGGSRITRSAIYRAWLGSGGGGAGQILRRLGVPLESLEPDRPFPPAVKRVGRLTEDECAAETWRILQLATGLAASCGASAVASAHLAAAMQSNSGTFSSELDRVGAHIDVGEWLRRGNAGEMPEGEARCSDTVDGLLRAAARIAGEEKRKVTEEDLFRAFVRSGGGSVGRALEKAGVWRKLADTQPRSLASIRAVGPIRQDGATADAWSALLNTVEFAGNAGRRIVCSFDLLAALQVDPAGNLAQRLGRLGFRIQLRSWVQIVGPSCVLTDEVPCSDNTNRVLLLAQAFAAADTRQVQAADLLQAFVQTGGGHAGKSFEERYSPLVALTSELFINGGALDPTRLGPDVQEILQRAVEFAGEKGWPVVTGDHLAYGMICHGGYFTSRLRADDLNPEQIGDLAFSCLSKPPAAFGEQVLTSDLRSFGSDLVRILCRAESRVGSGQVLGERDLAWAWADAGGGRFGQVLIEHNFRLRRLLQEESE